MRCVAVGSVGAIAGLVGLTAEAPAIVQMVGLCMLVASGLVGEFAFNALLGGGKD